MNNTMHINFDDDKKNSTWAYRSTDIDKLIIEVMQAGKEIHLALKQGLPKCVYQLALYNDLLKKGFHLQTEMSVLSLALKKEAARELIIVNDILVIECVVESKIHSHHHKRIMFDLENKAYIKSLLINFSSEMQSYMLINKNYNAVIH